MKTKLMFFIAITAIATVSFSFISDNSRAESGIQQAPKAVKASHAPIGGLVSER